MDVSTQADLRQKLDVFAHFYDKVIRFKGQRGSSSANGTSVLDVCQEVLVSFRQQTRPWGQDPHGFLKAWSELSGAANQQVLTDFRQSFTKFLEWSRREQYLSSKDCRDMASEIERKIESIDNLVSSSSSDNHYDPYNQHSRTTNPRDQVRSTLRSLESSISSKVALSQDGSNEELTNKMKSLQSAVAHAVNDLGPVSRGGQNTNETWQDLRHKLVESSSYLKGVERALKDDPFDKSRVSLDDLVNYMRSSDRVQKAIPSFAPDIKTHIEGVKKLLSVDTVATTIMHPAMAYARWMGGEVRSRLKSLPEKDPKRAQLERLREHLDAFLQDIERHVLSGERPPLPEVSNLVKTLAATPDGALSTKTVRRAANDSGDKRGPTDATGAGPEVTNLDGYLYRRVDKARVEAYLGQFKKFAELIKEHHRVDEQVAQQLHVLTTRASEIQSSNRGTDSLNMTSGQQRAKEDSLSDAKMKALKEFVRNTRKAVDHYVREHELFMTQRHRDAQEYMNYWIELKDLIKDSDVIEHLDEYDKERRELLTGVKSILETCQGRILEAHSKSISERAGDVALHAHDATKTDDMYADLSQWLEDRIEYVVRLYTKGSPSFLDNLLSVDLMIMYGLKAVRVLVAWYALRVASKLFQAMYDKRVYAQDEDPPHPVAFIALFLAVDVACHLILLAVLMLAKTIFTHIDDSFPVTSHMISAWAFDYTAASALIAALALLIGEVVRRKKYFRYKYEGDRGIRAMQHMMLYVYIVVLFVPFFRLVGG
jgi:hypothetical protein